MKEFYKQIESDFETWKNTPPNAVQRASGTIFKPIELAIGPLVKKVAPLLEKALISANDKISEVMSERSVSIADITAMNESAFEKWFTQVDKSGKSIHKQGIAALSSEGAATGLWGWPGLAVDIPASFGLMLTFANRIALNYHLDITSENVQIEILKAIAAGSETNVKSKATSAATIKYAAQIISKQTWKSMKNAPVRTMPGFINAVRVFLQKMGVNITKRKAALILPVVSAGISAIINGAWADDALEAVRQYARKAVVEAYKKERNAA